MKIVSLPTILFLTTKQTTMNNYETVFILTPVLSDEQAKEAVKKIEGEVKTLKGKVRHSESWGLRKLAYPIQKKSTGFYFLIELREEIQKNYTDLDNITVISFFPEVIKAIKRKESQIKCNLLIAFDYKEMHTQDILNLAMTTKADGIGAQNHERLDEKFIQAVRDIEKTIHVWTVNSNEEAESYYRNGIDSITTNKPLSIRNYLEALE